MRSVLRWLRRRQLAKRRRAMVACRRLADDLRQARDIREKVYRIYLNAPYGTRAIEAYDELEAWDRMIALIQMHRNVRRITEGA